MRKSAGEGKACMRNYVNLISSFVKKQYYPHLLLVLLLALLSGGFVSLKGLESTQAAKVMEMYVAFIGLILFTPLFMPEQDKAIWNLERSKKTSMWKVYLFRMLPAVLICLLTIWMFLYQMKRGGGIFDFDILFRGSCCEIFFLGSIGFFVSAVTNQVIIGYMIAVIYYVVNIGGNNYLGKFALFRMMKGDYGTWMYWLLGAVLLFASGIAVREKIAYHKG